MGAASVDGDLVSGSWRSSTCGVQAEMGWCGARKTSLQQCRCLHYCITVPFVVFRNMELSAGSSVVDKASNRKQLHSSNQPDFDFVDVRLTHIYAA
jgi:hypothetical protein